MPIRPYLIQINRAMQYKLISYVEQICIVREQKVLLDLKSTKMHKSCIERLFPRICAGYFFISIEDF